MSPVMRKEKMGLADRSGAIDDSTPWAEYVDVSLAAGVSRQALELKCDGPPGILHVMLSASDIGARHRAKDVRGTVLCCPGVYPCMEGPSCLFNMLASALPQTGVAVLQLAYRPPGD